MTVTQRVTDDDVRHVADQLKHDLDEARALAQSQAATIAELRAEVERLNNTEARLLNELDTAMNAAEAAESALATAKAKIEKLEAALRSLPGAVTVLREIHIKIDETGWAIKVGAKPEPWGPTAQQHAWAWKVLFECADAATKTLAALQEDAPHG